MGPEKILRSEHLAQDELIKSKVIAAKRALEWPSMHVRSHPAPTLSPVQAQKIMDLTIESHGKAWVDKVLRDNYLQWFI